MYLGVCDTSLPWLVHPATKAGEGPPKSQREAATLESQSHSPLSWARGSQQGEWGEGAETSVHASPHPCAARGTCADMNSPAVVGQGDGEEETQAVHVVTAAHRASVPVVSLSMQKYPKL